MSGTGASRAAPGWKALGLRLRFVMRWPKRWQRMLPTSLPSFLRDPDVVRSVSGKRRREPWYLLTNEPVETAEDAWRIVRAYARRWRIERCFRYCKSELALESPRLWTWERRVKLLMVVTRVYAFLLSLLQDRYEPLRKWLLRYFCHRTGKRSQETPAPLHRLRSALRRLWLAFPLSPPTYARNPG